MKLSTWFDLNTEDINTYFNEEVFQDGQETIQIVQELTEIEDQNVPVYAASTDQNVQRNAPNDEATQSKKMKASKFIPLSSNKVEIIYFEKIGQQELLLKEDSILSIYLRF